MKLSCLTESIVLYVLPCETQTVVSFSAFDLQMPGAGPNPQVMLLQPSEGVDYMTNEVAPEVIYDQGIYYPATNYYGYFFTGKVSN